jgi:Xanthine dehydrogenase, iron-sulfur cluster and FAD-binding subunit A
MAENGKSIIFRFPSSVSQMIKFILNNQLIETDLPKGMTVLDFVRYHKNLKGTKIGCREGDCGACTVMIGELAGERVRYRTHTSCLMPLANAHGKHIVTVEGVNKTDGGLTEVQRAMVESGATQCGFCTVGFVMSLTNFCLDDTPKNAEMAVSAIDGNICRCTGYKSIERACAELAGGNWSADGEDYLKIAVEKGVVPEYFLGIKERLKDLQKQNPQSESRNSKTFVSGGTDLYVQKPEEMFDADALNLFDDSGLKFITENGETVEIGASVVVSDLMVSPIFQRLFPNLFKHLKLVSSTPIRNMATLAGNFVNASPIGDMTAWFLALDASIEFNSGREIALKDFYLGYKKLDKTDEEFITKIRFRKNFTHFNFEKVSKRTFLDIASVNSAISLRVENDKILEANVSVGGVAPVPLYLRKTSAFLRDKEISEALIAEANEILQSEISPISDVRGSKEYKKLLAQQLFRAHFVEMFGV